MAKGARLAVRCTDLTPHTWEIDDESVTTGGFVRSMVWDPLGERLAVIFQGNQDVNLDVECVKSYSVLKSQKQSFKSQNVWNKISLENGKTSGGFKTATSASLLE